MEFVFGSVSFGPIFKKKKILLKARENCHLFKPEGRSKVDRQGPILRAFKILPA